MTSTGSIHFKDQDSGDEAWIGVRVEGATIARASSLKANGDIEVFFGRAEAEALQATLAKALEEANA